MQMILIFIIKLWFKVKFPNKELEEKAQNKIIIVMVYIVFLTYFWFKIEIGWGEKLKETKNKKKLD